MQVAEGAASATRTLQLVVSPPPLVLTTQTLPGAVEGEAYSFVPRASGGTGVYAWSVTSGALPPGLSLAGNGTIEGTPTQLGTVTFVLEVISGEQSDSRALDLVVLPPPVTIANASLPAGEQGRSYAATLLATGGTGTYSWSLVSGALPPGLSLGEGGAIGGTPTAFGTFAATFRVTSGPRVLDQAFTITIAPPPLVPGTATLPAGRQGQPYQAVLTASGGTGVYAWSVIAGSLPPGLALGRDGLLQGTPTASGTFPVTIRVTSGEQSADLPFNILIDLPLLSVTTTSLSNATLQTGYTAQLSATGGTGSYAWSIVTGALPAGIALSAGGALSGAPTASGVFGFTVRVVSGAQVADQPLTLTVLVPPLQLVTGNLPDGSVGVGYTALLQASGGTGVYAWSIVSGAFPQGIGMNPAGQVSGTPTTAGSSAVEVRVVSGAQSVRRTFAISISSLPLPAAPTGLVAVPGASPYRVDLSWQDNSGSETGFSIERAPMGTTAFSPLATVGPNIVSYQDGGLGLGNAWSYRVRALGTGGNSDYSNTASAELIVAATVAGVTGPAIGYGSIASLSAQVTNTGTLPWTFGVQASGQVGGGLATSGPYTATVTLQPGEVQAVQWPSVGQLFTAGLWDWKVDVYRESAVPMTTLAGTSGNVPGAITVGVVVAVHSSATLTAGDADNALAGATSALQMNDGPGDVACDVTLVRVGLPTTFSTGDGSIDTGQEFSAVTAVPGNVKVVTAINWCGSIGVGIIGCGSTPGTSLAVVRYSVGIEGLLWAHEYGHNKGLPHNPDANFIMYSSIGTTHRRVTAAECSAYQSR